MLTIPWFGSLSKLGRRSPTATAPVLSSLMSLYSGPLPILIVPLSIWCSFSKVEDTELTLATTSWAGSLDSRRTASDFSAKCGWVKLCFLSVACTGLEVTRQAAGLTRDLLLEDAIDRSSLASSQHVSHGAVVTRATGPLSFRCQFREFWDDRHCLLL